jgi:hypothetical protein
LMFGSDGQDGLQTLVIKMSAGLGYPCSRWVDCPLAARKSAHNNQFHTGNGE